MRRDFRFREIPYNYTSFSDREVILRYFDEHILASIETLRSQRVTGRSAKLLFETIGDIFIAERNPYIYQDFLKSPRLVRKLKQLHARRLETIEQFSNENPTVNDLVDQLRKVDSDFFRTISSIRFLQQRILFSLSTLTKRSNICFSPFHKVTHATDASDWRVEYPVAVLYPDSIDEVRGLIRAIRKLKLTLIARGGGTGLTGGAVPVMKNTVILNTEKFTRIGEIATVESQGLSIPTITVESGVVTDDVIDYCHQRGYVFATDPTSAWASTIGGNIAENAGGKKCVLWGTAIDNLWSFQMVNAEGDVLEIRRKNHPYRKIRAEDTLEFDIVKLDGKQGLLQNTIKLQGTEIRKRGLGKDITNKALGGLPGIQKEGGDGIILSATFVLYRPFRYGKTICMEFFGNDMVNASRAIVDVTRMAGDGGPVFLTALEHFDEKYVRAINYRNKSKRTDIPKAVLLIDVESNDESALTTACRSMLQLVQPYETEATLAADEQERTKFWNERKHLGAIAKHTNAFKLNEDVVIPIERLPEYAEYIDHVNIEKELSNQKNICADALEYFSDLKNRTSDVPPDRIQACIDRINALLKRTSPVDEEHIDAELKYFRSVLHGYDEIISEIEKVVETESKRKIVVATHMHAGDGNIHVNIPVHSNDYLMMAEADETAGKIMQEAVRIGGVVSGEHGIGLTKLKYIDRDLLNRYAEYKRQSDCENLFNPGKLDPDFPLHRIYTPSFNLLELEAFILEATDLEDLSKMIARCVRCGKCKSVCNTNYPQGSMLYNPRNKILAIGLITEAVLYFAQTLEMRSFKHFAKLREIADYCTLCHKCEMPCPVKIDFGDATLALRKLLTHRKKSKHKPFTQVALFYLGRKKYYTNKWMRLMLFKAGYTLQRIGFVVGRIFPEITGGALPGIDAMMKTKFPRAGTTSLREELKLRDTNACYGIQNRQKPVTYSVVYFPGCGSERMFPDIGSAAAAMLYHTGVRVVLPPEYLCCGYPFLANGRHEQAEIKSFENRVILHRMADTVGYMEIEAVLVSCGTCFEMLEAYEVENIFKGAILMDVNEFLLTRKLIPAMESQGEEVLYHEPCHNPLRYVGHRKTVEHLTGKRTVETPFCCGEAGTLALSRPDIAHILRSRKQTSLTGRKNVEILTSCPGCVSGLAKTGNGTLIEATSLITAVAEAQLGKNWKREFLRTLRRERVERILF